MRLRFITTPRRKPNAALKPIVGNLVGGHEKQMLAHIDGLARLQRQGNHLAGRVPRKSDVAWALRLRHHQRHPGQQTLEGSFHSHRRDGYLRIFPEQNMMREVNGITWRETDIGYRNVYALYLAEGVAELELGHVFSPRQLRPARFGDHVTRIDSCATRGTTALRAVADETAPWTSMSWHVRFQCPTNFSLSLTARYSLPSQRQTEVCRTFLNQCDGARTSI